MDVEDSLRVLELERIYQEKKDYYLKCMNELGRYEKRCLSLYGEGATDVETEGARDKVGRAEADVDAAYETWQNALITIETKSQELSADPIHATEQHNVQSSEESATSDLEKVLDGDSAVDSDADMEVENDVPADKADEEVESLIPTDMSKKILASLFEELEEQDEQE